MPFWTRAVRAASGGRADKSEKTASLGAFGGSASGDLMGLASDSPEAPG
ncbi:unnamed protein product, partial [Protopolystoma xenopodis]